MDDRRSPQLNIIWEGPFDQASSLATINREHTWNLVRSGTAQTVLVPTLTDAATVQLSAKLERLRAWDVRHTEPQLVEAPVVWVRHQWPPNPERPRGATWIIMQPWEMSLLPIEFADLFQLCG